MALLWCDGFDHYGTGATGKSNLTEGVYAEVGSTSSTTIQTLNPRTGSAHWRSIMNGTSSSILRRVFGGEKTTIGIAGAFYMTDLPTNNNVSKLIDVRDNANVSRVTLILQTTGALYVTYAGGNFVTPTPVVYAETYQHIEMLVTASATVGTIEVRVNGVTVISLSGINTSPTTFAQCALLFNSSGSVVTGITHIDLDDLFCYDDTGSYNNTFIGDRRVITLFPNANTATADWTPVGAASGYECIDEANPDGDTSYISATAPGSPGPVSEFGFDNLPAGISAISGVVLVEFARKTEAGIANTQWSIKSGASETAGADKPMTELYTFRQDVFEIDPASAAPFTPAEVDALLGKVERTA